MGTALADESLAIERERPSDNHHETTQIEIQRSMEAPKGNSAAMPAPYHPKGKADSRGANT